MPNASKTVGVIRHLREWFEYLYWRFSVGHANVLAAMEVEAKANWSDPYPLALDDRPFKQTDQHMIFSRHSVVFGEGERTSVGVGWYRYPGIQYLSIFYMAGTGNNSVYKLADQMINHYTDKILTDDGVHVNFGVASTIKLPQDANGFSQLQVICPFYFDTRS